MNKPRTIFFCDGHWWGANNNIEHMELRLTLRYRMNYYESHIKYLSNHLKNLEKNEKRNQEKIMSTKNDIISLTNKVNEINKYFCSVLHHDSVKFYM